MTFGDCQRIKQGIPIMMYPDQENFLFSCAQGKAVKQDINDWLPHIIPGGHIIFDDYASRESVNKAVNEAIDEQKIQIIARESEHNRTVLAKKL